MRREILNYTKKDFDMSFKSRRVNKSHSNNTINFKNRKASVRAEHKRVRIEVKDMLSVQLDAYQKQREIDEIRKECDWLEFKD